MWGMPSNLTATNLELVDQMVSVTHVKHLQQPAYLLGMC